MDRQKFHLYSWGGAALVAGILVAVNFIASYIPIRLDTSQGHVYSLSKGSKQILKQLDDRLVIKVVFSSALPAPYKLNEQFVTDLSAEYKRASHGKIRVEFLDPGRSPKAREEAMSDGVSPAQLDVRERDRREVKECFMGVVFLYGDRKESIPIIQDTENLEYEMTLRIKKLISPERPLVGIASNGEAASISSKAMESLMTPLFELYRLKPVDLAQPVPADVKGLWLIGPKKPLDGAAIANLKNYLSAGGAVGLLLDRKEVKITEFRASPLNIGMDPFLVEAGLLMRDGFVVDERCDRIQIQAIRGAFRMINVVDYPYFPWSSDVDRSHPATKGLDGVSMPFVSPIEILNKPGFKYTVLVRSSEASFLDVQAMDLNPLQNHMRTAEAAGGPFNLGVLVEGQFSAASSTAAAPTKPGRLVVFGTSRFVDSDFPAKPSNYNLFTNLVDWLVQDDALIQIRSRGFARRPLRELSDGSRLIFKYLMVTALPLLSLIIGLVVWRRQKIRRALLPLHYSEA